jgi:hypothetical protein
LATLKLALRSTDESLQPRAIRDYDKFCWLDRALVHRWRSEADAVMVGAGTVLADNPRLTCRVAGPRPRES